MYKTNEKYCTRYYATLPTLKWRQILILLEQMKYKIEFSATVINEIPGEYCKLRQKKKKKILQLVYRCLVIVVAFQFTLKLLYAWKFAILSTSRFKAKQNSSILITHELAEVIQYIEEKLLGWQYIIRKIQWKKFRTINNHYIQ